MNGIDKYINSELRKKFNVSRLKVLKVLELFAIYINNKNFLFYEKNYIFQLKQKVFAVLS